MADNVAITAGAGTTVATDQVTGTLEHVQLFKLAQSADGSRAVVQADASGLLVNVASVPSHAVTNAGTFAVQATLGAETTKVIGTVNVAAAQTIAVTGPLTDTQIRATALPVSNTQLPVALAAGGGLKVEGIAGGVAQPVSLATLPALVAGSAVIGHVIHDTGSTTAVTGNVTVVQPTGTSLHAVLDTTSTTAVTQATGTNLHAVLDSGTLTTVSTVTAVTAITNALPTGTNTLGSVKVTDGTTPVKVTVANAQPASSDGALLVNAIDTFAGTALTSASHAAWRP